MRRPDPDVGSGVVTLIERREVDAALALRQWESLRAVLVGAGWDVTTVVTAPDDPPCPDGVFIGDTVAAVGSRIVVARSAVETRVPERLAIRRTLSRLGVPSVPIRRPGTLDCGDIVLAGAACLYVGVGSRTDRSGLAQLTRIAEAEGLWVVPVPLHKAVQLDAGVTALPCGTVLGYPPLVDDPSVFRDFIPVPEAGGAQVLPLGGRRVLVAASASRSVATLTGLGYDVTTIDISEFEKREGSVPSLVVPL